MKKFTAATTILSGMLFLGFAPMGQADIALLQGQQNASVDGHIDLDSVAGTEVALRLGYGYYFQPAVEIGGLFEFANNDFITRYAIAAYSEYNWDLDYYWVPFLGASLGLGGLESFDKKGDSVGLELGLRGGAKYFVFDDFAVTGTLGLGLSTGDTYDDGGSAENVDLRLDVGAKWFW